MQDERRSSSIETVLIEMGEIKGLMSAQMIMVKDLGVKVGIQNGRVGKLEGWRTGYAFVFGALITVLMFFKEPILGAFSDRWTVEEDRKSVV